MQRDLPTGFAVGIGLMLLLPLLNYLRDPPIADFYGEWLSAVSFAIAALFLVPKVARKGAVSALLLFAPVVLGVLLLIQTLTGVIDYAYDWLTWSAYLTLLVLAYLIGQALRENGLERETTTRLSYALVLAGATNFGLQLIQTAGLTSNFSPFVVPLRDACRVAGNVAQANQATLLAWMSIMAALYLAVSRRMRLWVVALFVPSMLLSSGLTASRIAWLFLLLSIVVILAVRAWPGPSMRQRWLTACVLGVGFFLATLVASVMVQSMSEECATAFGRVANINAIGYLMRLELWRQAIDVWLSNPILGAGAGRYMAEVYAVQPLGMHQPLDYYAHNVWLQILAEFGTAAGLAIAATFVLWAASLIRHRETLAATDSVLLYWLGALVIHSTLEFPLYYVHFLVLFGLCAGLVIRPQWTALSVDLPLRVSVAALSIVVAIGCVAALIDYRRVDRAAYLVTVLMANNFGSSAEIDELVETARQDVVIYRPMADHAVDMLTPLNENQLDKKIEATERLVQKSPTSITVLRRIALALLADDEPSAVWHARRLVMFFPRSAPEWLRGLERHFDGHPDMQARAVEIRERALAEAPTPRW